MQNKWLDPAVDAYRKYFGDTANTIFDIGTRDGDDAEYFRQKLNGSKIYAFDANPLAVEETKKRYPNFNVVGVAMSNYNGKTKFIQIVSEDKDLEGCSSFVNIHNTSGRGSQYEIDVDVVRMDTFLNDVKIDSVDVIKIDTEGFSYEVLEGMGSAIHNVKLLHIETEVFNRHPGHRNNEDIKKFMLEKDFTLVDVSYEWGPTVEDQVWINNKLI